MGPRGCWPGNPEEGLLPSRKPVLGAAPELLATDADLHTHVTVVD